MIAIGRESLVYAPIANQNLEMNPIYCLRQNTYSDKFYSSFLLEKIKKITNQNLNFHPKECPYFNGQFFGQDGSIHYDIFEDDAFTFLLYCTEEYEPSMGGFTLFEENDKEIVVLPKYNRAVFFPGKLHHKAFSFSNRTIGFIE